MTTPDIELAAKIQAGANFLDQWHTDWKSDINIAELDIGNTRHCILGQLCGNFYDMKRMLDLSSDQCGEFGFLPTNYLSGDSYEMIVSESDALTRIWKNYLATHGTVRVEDAGGVMVGFGV